MRALARSLGAILLVAMAVPAVAQVTDEDIDRARSEVNDLLAGYQQLDTDVQDAWAQQSALTEEMADLEDSIDAAREQIALSEAKLEEVAVEMYMGAASSASIQVLFSAANGEYEAGLEYLREVSGDETDVINQLHSFRAELDRQTSRLASASEELSVVTADLERMAGELQEQLVAAQVVYDQLVEQQQLEEEQRRAEEEAARLAAEEAARAATTTTTTATPPQTGRTTTSTSGGDTTTTTTVGNTATTTIPPTTTTTGAPPPDPGGGGTCPVAGAVVFSDTWGAPRSGGRTHQGVDMMAARNTPVVAIYSGSIKRITTGELSGLAIWLRADNGDEFFYAHLESYGDISVGQAVTEGYVVGYVGTSGNAPDYLPHLHFEWHPDGGAAVNPYPLVKSLC